MAKQDASAAELVVEVTKLEETVLKRTDELAESIKSVNAEMADTGKLREETKGQLLDLVKKLEETHERLDGIDEKQAKLFDEGRDNVVPIKSLGQQFTEHEDFKGYEGKTDGRVNISTDLKAITNATPGQDQPLVRHDHVPGVIMPPNQRLSIRDLLMPGSTTSNYIDFTRELVFTNNADYQGAEGTEKPESDITFELAGEAVVTLAHWIAVSKQVMADAPMLQSYIDGRLRYGLKLKEEAELLNGDGTANNLQGIIPLASAYVGNAADSRADQVRRAMNVVELAHYAPTGIVMNPADWLEIELAKDADSVYYFGGPANSTQPRLWGLPVVTTQSLAVGQYMVGSFAMAAQLFDREDVNVQMSSEDRDNFVKNMLTVLCEERLALLTYRPASFVATTFA